MVDFTFLRQKGIQLLQQICGETWTDYNLHDPGVTILEALCYALTDLSYRTEFPMQDLLADKEGRIRLQQNAFFRREEILATNPVSVADCRKFMLDGLDQLHNVWLQPFMSEFSFGTMHGLYTVKVQVKKEFSHKLKTVDGSPLTIGTPQPPDDDWADQLTKKIRLSFVSARNLCEDIIRHITILRPVAVHIQAEVVIDGDDPETILAHIYRDLETAINPPVRYYTEKELLDKGFLVEDIHAGPHLKKGFIRDDELPARKLSIDPAELMKAVAGVPGVGYVRSLTLYSPEGSTDRIPYKLPPDSYPYFRQGPRDSPILLLRGKYKVQINEAVFNDIWPRVKEAARRSVLPVVTPEASPEIRHGQYRDVMTYRSLQHLFPVVYGIGLEGLGRHPSPQRIARARQLKGYLLSFEQLLANYLAQLAHLPEFFSPDNSGRTYYTQPLYDVPDVRYLLKAFTGAGELSAAAPREPSTTAPGSSAPHELSTTAPGELSNAARGSSARELSNVPDAPPMAAPGSSATRDDTAWQAFLSDSSNAYVTTLINSPETQEVYRERRNAVLDHLLARFNQQPSDYPVRLYSRLYAASGQDKSGRPDEVLEWKSALLKNIAGLSYNRVRGFDYLARDRHDNGGFYEHMMTLLYMPERSSANLSAAVIPYLKRPPAAARPADASAQPAAAPVFAHRHISFFQQGLHAGNYTIGPDPDGHGWLILFKESADADASAQPISRHPNEQAAEAALRQMIDRLRRINILSEGFYVIEHVLLRPPIDSDSFGFRFMATQKDQLLRHSQWTSFTRREQILTELIDAAKHAQPPGVDTSTSHPSGSGPSESHPPTPEWSVNCLRGRCRIQLTRHKDFGFLSDPADFEPWLWAEAAPDIENIRRQLILFNDNRLRFYPRFEMLVRGHGDNPIGEEFFNFNMTVLLPAWTARFQDENFRAFVMDLFRQHTPAHIRLYFQWLNISRMTEFEELYPRWVTAMKDQDDAATRRLWSERIIHFIKKGVY